MKYLLLPFSCFILLLFPGCGQENKAIKNDSAHSADSPVVNEEYSDGPEEDEISFSDSTYALQIKGKLYRLLLSHEGALFHPAGESTS